MTEAHYARLERAADVAERELASLALEEDDCNVPFLRRHWCLPM